MIKNKNIKMSVLPQQIQRLIPSLKSKTEEVSSISS